MVTAQSESSTERQQRQQKDQRLDNREAADHKRERKSQDRRADQKTIVPFLQADDGEDDRGKYRGPASDEEEQEVEHMVFCFRQSVSMSLRAADFPGTARAGVFLAAKQSPV